MKLVWRYYPLVRRWGVYLGGYQWAKPITPLSELPWYMRKLHAKVSRR